MSAQSKVICVLNQNRPGYIIEVEVRYRKGGIGLMTGNRNPRGYYLGVTPGQVKTMGGEEMKIMEITAGRTIFIEEAKMFSAKKLDTVCAQNGPTTEKFMEVVNEVLSKNNIRLADGQAHENPFPRCMAYNSQGVCVAVSHNIQHYPAFRKIPVIRDATDMRDRYCPKGGWVMQQDDGLTPAFTLYGPAAV